MDLWADTALNSSIHASNTRKITHDRLAQELASIASGAGIQTSSQERYVPYRDDDSRKRADLITLVGGIVPPSTTKGFTRYTRLIMDVKIGHTYESRNHTPKPNMIKEMEQLKRRKFQDHYHAKGFAFAPIVCNTWGEFGPDFLRFLWALADFAARKYYGLLPLTDNVQPCHILEDASDNADFRALRGRIYHDYRLRLLIQLYEGVTERVYGRTYALTANKYYLDWLRQSREVWEPSFHHIPLAPNGTDDTDI